MKTNLSEVMRNAWRLYRETVTAAPEAANKATFKACLIEAWKACSARREWDRMPGEDQYTLIKKVIYTERKRAESRNYHCFDWIRSRDDIDGLAATAWCRTAETIGSAENVSLYTVIARAVYRESQAIERSESRNPSAMEDNLIDIYADPMSERAPDPFNHAAAMEDIRNAAADDKDLYIMLRTGDGYTLAEIAADMGISHQAASKRLQACRERHRRQTKRAARGL